MTAPKVSVCMIVYNQELFISEAIESVLNQKTSFDFEIVIGEDASSDGTLSVIKRYLKQYPNKIKLISSGSNVGGQPNFIRTYKQCAGEYIAMLEGDDYWTDVNKLQEQVDFLEKNKDYSMCYHKVSVVQDETKKIIQYLPAELHDKSSDILDLAKGNMINTLSCVFRNNMRGKLPEWMHDVPVGDYCVHMLNARFGKIKYISKNMGVYRKHGYTSWSNQGLVVRWGQLFYSIHMLKSEFKGEIYELLSMQQFYILNAAMESANSSDRINFNNEYKREISSLALDMCGKIYSNHIQLQGIGARFGINIAKWLRKILR